MIFPSQVVLFVGCLEACGGENKQENKEKNKKQEKLSRENSSISVFILLRRGVMASASCRGQQGLSLSASLHSYLSSVCFLSSGANTVKSAGTILDDIGNMFDDLADQLDAMLD